MKTLGRAGVFFSPKVLSRVLVFLGVLNLLGKNLPAPEIDAVCQGHKEFVSFSWGFLSYWQAVMGQYCQYGFEFTFCFSLTKKMGIMYN